MFYLDQLEDIIREWVATVYHPTGHSGLCEPGLDDLDLSPAQMFEHGIARAGYIEAPRDPDLAFEFLPVTTRTIQPYGVQWDNRKYLDCEHSVIDNLKGQPSPYGGQDRDVWPISYNTDDITKVYFRDPTTRQWHTLKWEHAAAINTPMSEDGLHWARQQARQNYELPDDRLAIADLLKRWDIPLEMTPAEQYIALRLKQKQSWLAQALTTVDDGTDQARTRRVAPWDLSDGSPPSNIAGVEVADTDILDDDEFNDHDEFNDDDEFISREDESDDHDYIHTWEILK